MRKRTLGLRYRLIEEIGSGGMGTVYRARDNRTGNTVAVKILHPHLTRDAEYLERFRREIEITRSLASPNIIRVLDFGEDGSDRFLVMEYVAGVSLHRMLRQSGALPLQQALDIATQVATALEEAHANGVVHRDIKPENIIITPDGRVKVGDFGIARAQDHTRLTLTGAVMGTVQYMAPELLTGGGDARSDIYSLGVILYQMLVGAPPFEATTPWEVLRKHREDLPPAFPASLDVPTNVEAFALRCLEKDPARRPAAPDLAEKIAEISATHRSEGDERTRTHPTDASFIARGRSWPDKSLFSGIRSSRRRSWILAACVAVTLAIVSALVARSFSGERGQPPALAETSVPWPSAAHAISYVRESTSTGTDVPSLGSPGPTPEGADLHRIVHVGWPADPNDAGEPTYDFDLRGSLSAPGWSPLGDEVAICGIRPDWIQRGTQPFVLSRAGATTVSLQALHCGSIDWSPDGERLVFDNEEGGAADLYVADRLRSSEPIDITNAPDDSNHHPVWSPAGNKIAFVKEASCSLYLVNPDGTGLERLPIEASVVGIPAWSPDGNRIAFIASPDKRSSPCSPSSEPRTESLDVIDVTSRRLTTLVSDKQLVPYGDPRWSPDGRAAAFVAKSLGTPAESTIWVGSSDGATQTALWAHVTNLHGFAWSPDGASIAFASEVDGSLQVRLLDASTPGSPNAFPDAPPVGSSWPAWSPQLPVPYVPLRSLIGRGAKFEQALFLHMDASPSGQIALRSSIDSCRTAETLLPPLHNIDIFAFDDQAKQWRKLLDGSTAAAPIPSGDCAASVQQIQTFVARLNPGRDLLAVGIKTGSMHLVWQFKLLSIERNAPTVVYELQDDNGDGVQVDPNGLVITTDVIGRFDGQCCPSGIKQIRLSGSGQGVLVGQPTVTPYCAEGTSELLPPVFASMRGISIPCTLTSLAGCDCAPPPSGGFDMRSTFAFDPTTEISDEQGQSVPDLGPAHEPPPGSRVRVDKYRFDESGLVAEHLTLFSDSHIAQPELAYVGAEGDLWIANLDGSGATKITSSGDIAHPAWSHDGKILAYVRRRGDAEEIWTWRPGVGARLILQAVAYGSESPPRYALIRNLAWDASGTRIFYNEHRSAPNLSRIRTHSVYDPDLTAAHDSTLLDSSDLEQDNAEIAGFDITSDASTLVLEICSSPAGSSSGCGVYTRQIGDPARASTPVVPIKLGAFAGLPSLSPDGQLIAYYVYPRIEVVRRSTLELLVSQEAFPTTLNEDTFWPRIAWSPDSSSIYYETKVDGSSTIAFRNLTDQTLHALGDGRFPAIIH